MAEESVKCVVVGDGAVGKTCLLHSYSNNKFPEEYVPTVFDNYSTNVMCQKKVIDLNLLDTAGQDDYDILRPLSYTQTDIFLLCFDIGGYNSFLNIEQKWYLEIKKHNPNTPFILVGTKSDLRNNPYTKDGNKIEVIDYSKGEELAKKIGAVSYIETSAINLDNVKYLFDSSIIAALKSKSNPKVEVAEKSVCCSIF
ncbi:hypothetical protein MHBO_001687 [Bonamia ostreae]|uniref:Rho GTPase n=1 Tax=Bonamia ostreae TaxID=126728 RepID=A0ABV2AJU0_9EUKA